MKTKLSLILAALLHLITATAQTGTTFSGNVKNISTNENLPAVSLTIKGTNFGTFTDERGNFKIAGSFQLPVTLVFSSIGFANKEVTVSNASELIKVTLDPVLALAQEVVVSASRTPERILESPVSIERVSAAAIRNTAAANYYDMVGNLKGVDMTTSSLNFKTPSTRGFNGSGNLRLNQLVDGMDNQAPGLNFPVGSMIGLTELDVDNMELLSGASSALYGPGGMNGTLLINSKNPFKYQGLSIQAKGGIMHIADNAAKSSGYKDFSLRYAKAFTEKFAFKIGGQYIYAKDWIGQDYRNYNIGSDPSKGNVKAGDRSTDENYNGINVYGDETSADLFATLKSIRDTTPFLGAIPLPSGVAYIPSAAIINPYIGNSSFSVSRTGYLEKDVIDPVTENLRLSAALHYKFAPGIEASLSANAGSGTTVYTGSDRYSLKDFLMGQFKAEVKHKNWFVRAYTTREDAGKSFNATITTRLMNEAWKDSKKSWYPEYLTSLLTNSGQLYGIGYYQAYTGALAAGSSDSAARALAASVAPASVSSYMSTLISAARDSADRGRPGAGSSQFKTLFDSIAARPLSNGGGLLIDKSSLSMVEGQYNLSDKIKFAELIIGTGFKPYVLNSEGTIFADTAGRITINEAGAYALIAKKFLKDAVKLTAAGRYDKNSNFKGRFTPRFSAVITVAKNNNIRLSYQTAYRFPSTQNQWINLGVGAGAKLIGGLPELRNFYHFNTNQVYTSQSFVAFAQSAATGNYDTSILQTKTFGEYKPESVSSYEIGYKTLINNHILIDIYGYYSAYQNFIGRTAVAQSANGAKAGLLVDSLRNIFSVSVNSSEKVNTQGYGASVEYLLPHNFSVNANFYSDEIKNVPANFTTYYNTPKYRTNIGFSNNGFLYKKRFGFSLQYRYQDAFRFESDYGTATIPAYSTLDAQINYKVPSIKSMFKMGGTNITNHYYTNGFGMPQIGGLFYVSFAYGIL